MKYNAIKILEDEQKQNDIINRNLGKEDYMNRVYDFTNDYLFPLLEPTIKETEKYKSSNEEEKILIIRTEFFNVESLINDLGTLDDFNDEDNIIELENETSYWLEEDEINFLYSNKATKNKVAKKLSNLIIDTIK